MTTALITVGGPPFLINAGTPNNGGKIYFYEVDTSTPKTVYKDSALTMAHDSPLVLDAYGWPPGNAIWCSGAVDMDIQTSAGVSLRTIDNVNATFTTASVNTVVTKSDNYTIVAADDSKTLAQTAAGKTFSTSEAAAGYGNGFTVYLQNRSTGTLTFDPFGAETVTDGETSGSSVVLEPYYNARIICDGTNWVAQISPAWTDIINPNWLINGGFQIAQDGSGPFTSATTVVNNDDSYLFDQWILLGEANDAADVSRITTAAVKEPASSYAIDFDVETSNKKFGFLQILDAERTKALFKGGAGIASLSFTICQAGGGLTKWKAAVLAWTGTVDSPTSDIVSAWGADGVTPTFIANITAENTAATTTLTTSPVRVEIENIALDTAGTTNLMVFLWSDDLVTTAGTDHAYLSAVKLEAGPYATEYTERQFSLDYYDALFFYWKSIRESTNQAIASGVASGAGSATVSLRFPRKMRIAPTMSVSSANDFLILTNAGAADDSNAMTAVRLSTDTCLLRADTAAVLTSGVGAVLEFDATANGFIAFDARL